MAVLFLREKGYLIRFYGTIHPVSGKCRPTAAPPCSTCTRGDYSVRVVCPDSRHASVAPRSGSTQFGFAVGWFEGDAVASMGARSTGFPSAGRGGRHRTSIVRCTARRTITGTPLEATPLTYGLRRSRCDPHTFLSFRSTEAARRMPATGSLDRYSSRDCTIESARLGARVEVVRAL